MINGLGLSASGRGAAAPLPGPTKLSRYLGHQRSRPTSPTPGVARHRQGKRDHCFALVRHSGSSSQLARCCCTMPMHLVTARYRIVLIPSSQQRGHVALQVAALDCSATAPLSPSSAARYVSQCTRRCCAPCRGGRGAWSVLRSVAVRALWRWVCATPRCASWLGVDLQL